MLISENRSLKYTGTGQEVQWEIWRQNTSGKEAAKGMYNAARMKHPSTSANENHMTPSASGENVTYAKVKARLLKDMTYRDLFTLAPAKTTTPQIICALPLEKATAKPQSSELRKIFAGRELRSVPSSHAIYGKELSPSHPHHRTAQWNSYTHNFSANQVWSRDLKGGTKLLESQSRFARRGWWTRDPSICLMPALLSVRHFFFNVVKFSSNVLSEC